MPLSELQQQRLLHWARRLREVTEGESPVLDPRELAALKKLIDEVAPILYPPVKLPPGMPTKLD